MITKALRNLLAERDSYTCVLCTNAYSDIHHYTPRSKGGKDTPSNLVCLCRPCHMRIHRHLDVPKDWCDMPNCHRFNTGQCPGDYWCWMDEMEYRLCEYLSDYYAEELQTY